MNIFFNETPIVLNTVLAKLIGLNRALVLQQMHYWIEINRKANKNFRNGYFWTYNTYQEWKKNNFDFWSTRTITRIIQDLEKNGLLISDNFNKKGYDRTKWYRINYDSLNLLYKKNDDLQNTENSHIDKLSQSVNISTTEDNIIKSLESVENTHVDKLSCPCTEFGKSMLTSCQVDVPNLATPIPETKTETNYIDLTTTNTNDPTNQKEAKDVVVNNHTDFNLDKNIEVIQSQKQIIFNKLDKHNIKFSQKQIEFLIELAENNLDVIIQYIDYIVNKTSKIDNPFGYLKSLILKRIAIKEDKKDGENIEKYMEQIEIINKKLRQNSIVLDDKQTESLLELADYSVQVVITYIDYMLTKPIKIDSVYAYLRSAIIGNWDTKTSNYEGKTKDNNPNKIVNYTGRTWDFEKIRELEQKYLEDKIKNM